VDGVVEAGGGVEDRPTGGVGVGGLELSSCNTVGDDPRELPDYLPNDGTLAQVAVLVRVVFQILRLDSAGRTSAATDEIRAAVRS
jgi:hypothetical protein